MKDLKKNRLELNSGEWRPDDQASVLFSVVFTGKSQFQHRYIYESIMRHKQNWSLNNGTNKYN